MGLHRRRELRPALPSAMPHPPQITQPTLALIAAVARNGVIGNGDTLPWRIKADLLHFQETTWGCPVIMGRSTWDSLGRKPLYARNNIVVSSTLPASAPGEFCDPIVCATPEDALIAAVDCARSRVPAPSHIFVIGGATMYRRFAPLAQTIFLTRVDAEPDGDTYFPEEVLPENRNRWHLIASRPLPGDGKAPSCTLETWSLYTGGER